MLKFIVENIADHPEETFFTVKSNETLYYVIYGYALVEKRIVVILEGEGAEAHMTGILIGVEGACMLHTLQQHAAPSTTSDLLVKTVLTGNASFNFHGMIQIEQSAQRSNAYQRNENILLSPAAKVESKPELEILANDVRCTHGATMGKLDEMTLFYIQSRGLPRKEAESLALRGFLNSAITRIPDEYIQAQLQEYILKELMV